MRMLTSALFAVLAFGTLVVADAASCRADETPAASASVAVSAPDAVAAPQPGTVDEERSYARREAESPAAQDFTGGWVIGFLILVALVVIIVLMLEK